MSLPKSKSFIYLRRSQDREDRQSLSIEKQDKQVKQIIERNELAPVYLPAEERSAKYPGRPVFNDMMDRVESGEARYIAVWALSRLSRNPVDGGRIIYALDTGKLLAIHTPTRTYRNTPDDKMVLAIELALAKKNNDDLSVQVKEGFDTKRTRGQYPGPAPIGYLNAILGPGVRNIVPDAEKAPLVKSLFEYAATANYSLDEVCQYARQVGLTSRHGLPLAKQTIVEILKRRAYCGVFKYGGDEWHQGTYEPLISTELYDHVQLALGWAKQRARNSTHGRSYAYKGPFVCGTCNHNITAYIHQKKLRRGGIAEYTYYTCTKKSKVVDCKEPQITEQQLEQLILDEVSKIKINEQEAATCISLLKKYHHEQVNNRVTLLEVWKKDQLEARKKMDKLLELRINSEIDAEQFNSYKLKYEETLARTTALIADTNTDANEWLELAENFFSNTVTLTETFEMADVEEKRRLLMELGSNWVLSNKKVRFTPRKPYDLLINRTDYTVWRARPDSNRRSPP